LIKRIVKIVRRKRRGRGMNKTRIQVSINHYERKNLSELVFKYQMDYDLWKKTFSENLKRYRNELKKGAGE
jgi:chloramphenicol O-acetyltransferase